MYLGHRLQEGVGDICVAFFAYGLLITSAVQTATESARNKIKEGASDAFHFLLLLGSCLMARALDLWRWLRGNTKNAVL